MKDRNTFVNSKHNFPKAKCAQPNQLLIMMKPLALWMRTEQQTSFTSTLACFLMQSPLAAKKAWTRWLVNNVDEKSGWTDKLKTAVNRSKSNQQLATSDISLWLI